MHDILRVRISGPGHVVHTCSPSTREAKAGFMSLKQARLHSYSLSLWGEDCAYFIKDWA